MKYQVVVILVAHPRKSNPNYQNEEYNNDDISGSSDITNKVDVIMNYCRNADGDSDSLLMVTKNRLGGILLNGKKSALRMNYNEYSKRVCSSSETTEAAYGWELYNGAWQSQQLGIPWEMESN